MKGRTFVDSFLARTVPMTIDQERGYFKSKLLSARGCDSIEYSEGDRQTAVSTKIFDRSSPDISPEQLDLDLELYDEICTRTCGN